jgi:hypothetical protein
MEPAETPGKRLNAVQPVFNLRGCATGAKLAHFVTIVLRHDAFERIR